MCACAVETHMDISRAILCFNLQEKMPDPPVNTSIEHRAFYPCRKNPFSVATLFGEICVKKKIEQMNICQIDCQNVYTIIYNYSIYIYICLEMSWCAILEIKNPGIEPGSCNNSFHVQIGCIWFDGLQRPW